MRKSGRSRQELSNTIGDITRQLEPRQSARTCSVIGSGEKAWAAFGGTATGVDPTVSHTRSAQGWTACNSQPTRPLLLLHNSSKIERTKLDIDASNIYGRCSYHILSIVSHVKKKINIFEIIFHMTYFSLRHAVLVTCGFCPAFQNLDKFPNKSCGQP